jgi:tripartite-type tricarboxylate transporter receptor subunit TctC
MVKILHSISIVILTSLFCLSDLAMAQTYPDRAIQLIIPYPPGGASDVVARILGPKMSSVLGQPVVIQNRPGANGNIAADDVARAKPDGYTLLMGNVGPNAINPAIYKNVSFDPIKSFVPITQTGNTPMVVVVNVGLPVKNMGELLAYLRNSKPPAIFATGGIGAATHLTSGLLEDMGKLKLTHVQYSGDAFTLNDMIGGHVMMGIVTLPALLPFIHNDKLRILAVTTMQRTPKLPNTPTIAESGIPGFDSASWGGIFAPAGTPAPVVDKLNSTLVKILKDPEIENRLGQLGIDIVGNSSQQFAAFLGEDVKKWAGVVKATGISAN